MTEFGSFHDFCTETTSGICRIFRSQPQPTCVLNAIHFSNQDYQVSDLGSFIVSCITTTLEPKDGPLGLTSPALFTLYYIFPLACLLGYLGLQTILVLYFLSARKPFWYLYSAALSFTVGQIFLLVLSDPLCRASENVVDGSLFSTLFTTASLVLLCFYWSAITLDENDEYETVAVA
ncbi:hypothetical protein IWQ62_002884 [Dispira parvispora]|uniref:Chitin synthase export chaperone n=1 Tax=Dispira parvispora TaxID=1520584 RepID=A0A9W8E3E8_9FUNG|nr:hypothetical protein IWQ62_002884 [Dispira parvispora]